MHKFSVFQVHEEIFMHVYIYTFKNEYIYIYKIEILSDFFIVITIIFIWNLELVLQSRRHLLLPKTNVRFEIVVLLGLVWGGGVWLNSLNSFLSRDLPLHLLYPSLSPGSSVCYLALRFPRFQISKEIWLNQYSSSTQFWADISVIFHFNYLADYIESVSSDLFRAEHDIPFAEKKEIW